MRFVALVLALMAFSMTARAEQGDAEDRALMDKVASEAGLRDGNSTQGNTDQGTMSQRKLPRDKSEPSKGSQ
ncbi:hypothetical protein [Paraburkholderia dilworthii]|uniref:hypothetical protein n=1 Tax=Paraburkholderia dilworthii TaxID=948106 RepID=UPI0004896490|nr:hypothetical protein [Paraburkholderia dilworthii]